MFLPSTERGMPAFGCADKRQGSGGPHALDGVQHGHRTHAAVATDDVRAPLFQPRRKGLRIGTIQAVAVFVDRDLHDQWQFRAHILGRQHGLMEFLQVSEGFQHQQIDPALRQRRNLLAKCLTGFFERGLSQGLDSGSQRANRSRYPHIEALGGFAGKPRARPVNVMHFVGDTVPCQPEGIRPESVGFDDLGPSLQVVVMNATNQVGLGKIQFVVAAVDEHAVGVKQRSHGSVA